MKTFLAIAFACVFITAADAGATKKHVDANGNVIECKAPKRWVEVDDLASDAGRRSKRICKLPRALSSEGKS